MKRKTIRKRFGQHFLIDQNIIDKIIHAIAPKDHQTIIEIGPGEGALTIPLLNHLSTLHVIEIDRDLAQSLCEKHIPEKKIIIHCLDVLNFDFNQIDKQPLRVIGNLPYNIATPLIFHLLKFHHLIDNMLFMLQEEIVNRLCATPNNRAYGSLSILVQALCKTEKLFTVGAEAFSPPPKVRSAIIQLTTHDVFLKKILHYESFVKIVKKAFATKRKTISNCLHGIFDANQLATFGITPSARAETLTIQNFISLSNMYYKQNNDLS